MQLKDGKNFLGGLNTDDIPSQLPPGDYPDLLNSRTGSSDQQHGAGLAETLQGEIETLINPESIILYYGQAIGGGFIYSGYEEVTIGTQVWMKKNWDGEYPGSKFYDSDDDNIEIYGRLYTWDQVMADDFCPAGWHVPTEADWDVLLTYLGGAAIAGAKMKEPDVQHWITPNTGADDSSGFKALPGGQYDTSFDLLGESGLFWIADGGVPTQPVALPATELAIDSFMANWEIVDGVLGYYLDVAEDLAFTVMVAGYNNKDVGLVAADSVIGLADEKSYYYRVRAYNDEGASVNSNIITAITLEEVLPHLIDRDGNIYNTVIIGIQEWIIENLKTTKYFDLSDIPNIPGGVVGDELGWEWRTGLISNPLSYETFITEGKNILSAINTTAEGNADNIPTQFSFNAGDLIQIAVTLVKNSGAIPSFGMQLNYEIYENHIMTLTEGYNAFEFTVLHTGEFYLWLKSTANADFSATFSVRKGVSAWGSDVTGAYCWYDNLIANKALYGALYNWYAVNNAKGLVYFERGGIKEDGWRMPTSDDWDKLIATLGGETVAGAKLKELGAVHWNVPNGTNESGFTALPGGWRDTDGAFSLMESGAGFWHADEFDAVAAWWQSLSAQNPFTSLELASKHYGFSVRCVRDAGEASHVLPADNTTNLTIGNKLVDGSIILNYVAIRGALYQQGEIILLNRGTSAEVSYSYDMDDIGLTVTGSISGNNLKLNLIVDNSSSDDVEFYYNKDTVTL
jgi:uncharacterized protein (TIGR02145 family)